MGLLDGILGGASESVGGVGASVTSGAKGGGSGLGGQAIAMVASMIVDYAFASSIKKDQKKFEKEIAKLDAQKQNELLQKIQQVQTELQRQQIVYQYVDKARIDELKEQTKKENKYLYIAIGVGILIYGLMIINLRKK
jgi:ABC-type anion transport system duplicated permease subunit